MTDARATGRAALILVAAVVSGCAAPAPWYDVTTNVYVGAERSCDDLDLSAIRCTAVVLRAARELERLRPGHGPVTSRSLHELGHPPAGVSLPPQMRETVAVVVFSMADGKRVGVPVLCPRGGSSSDDACNPNLR